MNEVPYVNIIIYDIPSELVKEFGEKLVRTYYPRGISQTIKDLMRKAIKDKKEKAKKEAHAF
jgi:metal-responsive CopG/Arc/MetJ family transcriptional regulator